MFCSACGAQNAEGAPQCTGCGRGLGNAHIPAPGSGIPEGVGLLVPINPEPMALISGYVGLAGFLLCGLPGPVAVVLGVLGLRRITSQREKHGKKLSGKSRAWTGIVLGAIQIIVCVWFGMLIISGGP